jgi:Ca-activated chloride channel family protein
MKTLTVLVLFVVLLSVLGPPVYADGLIIPDPRPPGQPPFRGYPLTIEYHHVTVTIENQVATTHVDQVFVNDAGFTVEGTYIFPLPEGATISEFAMWVQGKKHEGKLLTKEEARAIYESYVRRQQDPALLEYVGRGAFQASIFPIPPGEERRIELTYSEILTLDEGLVRYRYPLDTERFSNRPLNDVSISLDIQSKEALKAIYSPSHLIAVDRQGDYRARVGYEEHDVKPDRDFELYFSVAEEEIGLNLLSYKPADEDGFFLMLVAPKVEIEETEVVAKDVLLVLDTSGSMRGDKIHQAKAALDFVLEHLQPQDRFNIAAFSTGVRHFAPRLQPAQEREEAQRWVQQLDAAGGTAIDRALLETLLQVDPDRPTILIFLTDGLPTEGVVEPDMIMANVAREAQDNVRLFTFGVGHDVNTILLDGLAQAHRGASAYLSAEQSIDEVVSAFYAKVSTPVLADLKLDFGDLRAEEMFPYPLPDLFAGTQLVLVGRYRHGGPATLTLSGDINQEPQSFTYEDLTFRREGGEPFIARLWATRKIGYLLDQIRLHGKDTELVDEVVRLSMRYGIATPYTSFLVEERQPIPGLLSPTASPRPLEEPVVAESEGLREMRVEKVVERAMNAPALSASGAEAVADAGKRGELRSAARAPVGEATAVRHVGQHTFVYRSGIWVDTGFDPEAMQATEVPFASARYFELAANPDVAGYLALGPQVIFLVDGQAYHITPSEETDSLPSAMPDPTGGPATQGSPRATALPRPALPSGDGGIMSSFWAWVQGLWEGMAQRP